MSEVDPRKDACADLIRLLRRHTVGFTAQQLHEAADVILDWLVDNMDQLATRPGWAAEHPITVTLPDIDPKNLAAAMTAPATRPPDPQPGSRYAEAEAKWGHPLQYAYIGTGPHDPMVVGTEDQSDEQVRARVAAQGMGAVVERYNRCPTCEQWSPCDVRAARETARLSAQSDAEGLEATE
jgi:hypothetical protein